MQHITSKEQRVRTKSVARSCVQTHYVYNKNMFKPSEMKTAI